MKADESLEEAINAAEHYNATGGLPSWAKMAMVEFLTSHSHLLRATLARNVDDSMVQRAVSTYQRETWMRAFSEKATYDPNSAMKAALLAALGVEGA